MNVAAQNESWGGFDGRRLDPVVGLNVGVGVFHPAPRQRLGQVFHRSRQCYVTGVVADPRHNGVFVGPAGHQTVIAVVGGTGFDGEVPALEVVELVATAAEGRTIGRRARTG